jgi:hypothetical protein
MNPKNIETVIAADLFQMVIVTIGVIIFLYVRLACGAAARYFVHFALAYLGIGILYGFNAISDVYFHFAGMPNDQTKAILQMIDSTLSLLNTAFFFTAWYLMRDLRHKQEFETSFGQQQPIDSHSVTPTMTKSFIEGVIGALVVGIASYILMAEAIIRSKPLEILFSVIDVTLSLVAAVLIASEFLLIRLIRDPGEGNLFTSRWSHLALRCITALLFFAFGALQFSYLFSFMENPPPVFAYPEGQAYQVLAALKILCAGAAGILGIHALPSVRWKHGLRLSAVDGAGLVG